MNGLWCDFVINVYKPSGRNVQIHLWCLRSIIANPSHFLTYTAVTHTHTQRVSAVCVWMTGLCCAVFRRRDCTSTKCSACSPPAPRSCALTSTWTWCIAKTGTNMSKVKTNKQIKNETGLIDFCVLKQPWKQLENVLFIINMPPTVSCR